MEWDPCAECDDFPDTSILYDHDDGEFRLETGEDDVNDEGPMIEYYFYEGIAFGQTRIDFCFSIGSDSIVESPEFIHRSFDIYVGLRPTLMAVTSPRHSCNWCGISDRWSV